MPKREFDDKLVTSNLRIYLKWDLSLSICCNKKSNYTLDLGNCYSFIFREAYRASVGIIPLSFVMVLNADLNVLNHMQAECL